MTTKCQHEGPEPFTVADRTHVLSKRDRVELRKMHRLVVRCAGDTTTSRNLIYRLANAWVRFDELYEKTINQYGQKTKGEN